ncbi:MAG: acyloxyacyl hydrolase [Candidatus Adiutrix sp.]|jgi:lipid A 3-O-deacylase|nr:acyloxyacyl hydrolase [Candidatus Adiutrix sp.]
MKKLFLGMIILVCLGTGKAAGAWDSSFNLAAGAGTADSFTVDLQFRQDYAPWVSGQSYALNPFTLEGLTYWRKDGGGGEEVAGLLASAGLELSYFGDYFRPYVSVNAGPSLISEKTFLGRDLGGHFVFNTRAMIGLRFGQGFRHNLGVHATHYSNAHLYDDNDGFNSLGLSYGFSF